LLLTITVLPLPYAGEHESRPIPKSIDFRMPINEPLEASVSARFIDPQEQTFSVWLGTFALL